MTVVRTLVMLAVAGACGQGDPQVSAEDTQRDDTSAVSNSAMPDSYLISSAGIGAVRLAMTLDEARRAMPAGSFARTSDGDGVALVEVTLAPDTSLVLFAEEDDAEAPIDWTKEIRRIETFSAAFHTTDGVRPGALVTDVEGVLGKTREIVKSEIESREFIEFERQPAFLTFRLDYTGVFSGEARTTREYKPEAKILSIAVSPR